MSDSSKEQAKAQYENIIELLENKDLDAIQEDALSVQVRSDWQNPGEKLEPAEYELLLCTGGPAVRVIGTLNDYKEPETAKLQHQDWFEGWKDYHEADEKTLLEYAQSFFYGE